MKFFVIQIAADNSSLTIYDGGSEQAEMIANLHGTMNDIKLSRNKRASNRPICKIFISNLKGAINGTISTPSNQVFIEFNMNGNKNASIKLNAAVLESK